MDLFFPGAMGESRREFQCRDAATGELKWRADVPDEVPTVPAVADIDGDGRDECIFTMANTIYAVGLTKADAASPSGSILWTLDLPARAGAVAIADIEGDGVAQIVVMGADGNVYGIGAGVAD